MNSEIISYSTPEDTMIGSESEVSAIRALISAVDMGYTVEVTEIEADPEIDGDARVFQATATMDGEYLSGSEYCPEDAILGLQCAIRLAEAAEQEDGPDWTDYVARFGTSP